MATRNGQSYFSSLIEDLFDQDIPNRQTLFKGCIHKLHDGIVAGRDLVFNLAQQLGSTNAGTSAVQRGTIVMGTLAFYDPVDVPTGDLDGKTLILQTDLAGPVTVTFAQPTSPAHAATQINTQAAALGLVASVDTGVDPNTGAVVAANVGKLLLARPSGGTASLTVKGAGTANAILGLPLVDTTTTGAGTANDGASRIGLGAFGSWAGGTLQSYLQTVVSVGVADVANRVAKAGDTMSGALTTTNVVISNASNSVTIASRSVTRSTDNVINSDGAEWIPTATGRFINDVVGKTITVPLDLPHGTTLTSASVTYVGAGGHVGLPAVKPNVTIYKTHLGTGTDTAVSSTDDTSATTVDFQAVHTFGPTGLTEVVDRTTYRYNAAITSEAGANSLVGGVYFGTRYTCTVTRLDETR